jgi:hypothetical protein
MVCVCVKQEKHNKISELQFLHFFAIQNYIILLMKTK